MHKPISFHAELGSSAVNSMLWYLISHLDITRPRPWVPIPLPLTIGGKLNDGPTLWEGTATAPIINWSIVFPPP
jgi:hypothetical protein